MEYKLDKGFLIKEQRIEYAEIQGSIIGRNTATSWAALLMTPQSIKQIQCTLWSVFKS